MSPSKADSLEYQFYKHMQNFTLRPIRLLLCLACCSIVSPFVSLQAEETKTTELCEQQELVPRLPVITSQAHLVVEFGQPFEYKIEASHEPLGYSVKNKPFWLQVKGAVLSGSPMKIGESVLTIVALNQHGISEPFELTLKVVPIGQSD